jgi:hypothetical protein
MTQLWTPPQAKTLPRAGLPPGDLVVPGVGSLKYGGTDGPLHIWRGPKQLGVLGSMDPTPHGNLLHVSLTYPDHDPSWKVIRAVRDAFFPATVDVMMVLPRAEDYVNIHPHCFHLWQTPVGWGIR